jgi:hypothetical protein
MMKNRHKITSQRRSTFLAKVCGFIRDINLSLRALKLELGDDREPKGGDAI